MAKGKAETPEKAEKAARGRSTPTTGMYEAGQGQGEPEPQPTEVGLMLIDDAAALFKVTKRDLERWVRTGAVVSRRGEDDLFVDAKSLAGMVVAFRFEQIVELLTQVVANTARTADLLEALVGMATEASVGTPAPPPAFPGGPHTTEARNYDHIPLTPLTPVAPPPGEHHVVGRLYKTAGEGFRWSSYAAKKPTRLA